MKKSTLFYFLIGSVSGISISAILIATFISYELGIVDILVDKLIWFLPLIVFLFSFLIIKKTINRIHGN